MDKKPNRKTKKAMKQAIKNKTIKAKSLREFFQKLNQKLIVPFLVKRKLKNTFLISFKM
jgi:hypothetical protein